MTSKKYGVFQLSASDILEIWVFRWHQSKEQAALFYVVLVKPVVSPYERIQFTKGQPTMHSTLVCQSDRPSWKICTSVFYVIQEKTVAFATVFLTYAGTYVPYTKLIDMCWTYRSRSALVKICYRRLSDGILFCVRKFTWLYDKLYVFDVQYDLIT